jgi:hypothetical protein
VSALPRRPSVLEASDPSLDECGELVSVVVLVAGRPEPLDDLYQEVSAVVRQTCDRFEFVFVVEPPFMHLTTPLVTHAAQGEPIRIVRAGHAAGETALLREGVLTCRGSIVLTVPARRRVETRALAELLETVRAGSDMAVARRWPRRDSWIDQARSRIFHALITHVVGGTTATVSDLTSGVRAMRRDLFDRLPLYGESARFLPLLASRDGYSVTEVRASQHADDKRNTHYSPVTYLRSLFDLLSLFFLLRFTERPLRFFGLVGSVALVPGALILAVLFVERLARDGIADRPLLLLGVLFVVLGVQMIALGLIGEIIVHFHASQRASYRIKRDMAG